MRWTGGWLFPWLGLCAACGTDARVEATTAPVVQDAGAGQDGGSTSGDAVDAAQASADAAVVSPPAVVFADASSEEKPCGLTVVNPVRTIPDMLIVLDRSGSMNPDNNDDNADRWGGSRDALIEVTSQFDDRVDFGLMTYPGGNPTDRNRDDCSTGMLDVPVGEGASGAIATSLNAMTAGGRTPTAATLQQALTELGPATMGPDEAGVTKYVLLVTDGDPNCGGERTNGVDEVARTQSIAAIDALREAGIETFVIGYQTAGTAFADQLDAMAQAGGTGAQGHSSVTSGADLSATIAEIAGKVISCTYKLDVAVEDIRKVLVEVGGVQRNREQQDDGFQLEDDMRSVTLLGAACDDVRAGKSLKMTVTCDEVPLT